IARVNEVLLEGIQGKAERDLGVVETAAYNAAKDTLALGSSILKTLRDDVQLKNKPFNFQLPGELDVADVFGDVLYNRQTKLLRGSFGGRIEFPNLQNAHFEINHAS